MKTILQLCTSPDKGGLELYFADLSNQLTKNFNLYCGLGMHSKLTTYLDPIIPTFLIHKTFHYLPLLAAWKLSKIIDKKKIEVIHLHWNKDLPLAIFSKLFSKQKLKVILTRHMQFPAKKDSFYHRFIYKNLDSIIAITKTMQNDLKRFIPLSVQPYISTIYLGVDSIETLKDETRDLARKPYAEKNEFLIGLFGRISPYKGQRFLIEALNMAKTHNLPFKAIIVGHAMNENYLQELKKEVNLLSLENHIIFTGFVTNPKELMQACDVVVLTTVEETFGLVLIEAMSVGIPVIGSNRGGVPEIIEDQYNGLLFESQNSDDLFYKLKELYDDPEKHLHFGENAKKSALNKFSKQKHIEQLVQFYKSL